MSAVISSTVQGTGVTSDLVDRVSRIKFSALPESIVEVAKQCVLDWLGVTIAGAEDPLVQILRDEAAEQGGRPRATLLGRGGKVSTLQAALVNGTASHALDYDDVNVAIEGHPSVAVLPGLLALAEYRGASGAEFIAAFTAGYETACRVGLLIAPGHYEKGFHATATVGAFGAAAACAHLLGLDREQTRYALGIAGTQAAGLKAMFGTMCKPLHAGKASQNGLMAATLAGRGFDSRDDVLECGQGFAATQSGDFDPKAALADPPGGFHMRANLFKYHAACYFTHAAIECCRRLKEEHAITPENIAKIVIRAGEGCDMVCNIQEPKTGLEAKFSLRMVAAFVFAGIDTAALDSYSVEHCTGVQEVALRNKVAVEFDGALGRMRSSVCVTLNDGSQHETTHDAGVPAADLAGQRRRLESKFRRLVGPVLGADQAEAILELTGRLEGLDNLDELLSRCSAP